MSECIEEYEKRAMTINKMLFSEIGFISTEALLNNHDANHRYIIVTFDNIHNWQQWYKSDKRRKAVAEIMQMLEEQEKIVVLEYIARS